MHYGDKEQLDNNILVVVVYKHGTDTEDFDFELSSIKQCQYFSPKILKKILYRDKDNSYKYFEKILEKYPEECWYEITFKELEELDIDYNKYTNYKGKIIHSLIPDNLTISIKDVSESGNIFDTLH